MQSARFLRMEAGLLRVRQLFLPESPDPTGASYDRDVQDKSAAYIALAHAEIQHFLDDRAKSLAEKALLVFKTRGIAAPETVTLASYADPSSLLAPTSELKVTEAEPFDFPPLVRQFITKVYLDYEANVRSKNNGIKTFNLKNLFVPLGFSVTTFNDKWLAKMDGIGKDRGDLVHKSLGSTIVGDPFSYKADVDAAVSGDASWFNSSSPIASLKDLDAEIETRIYLLRSP